PSSPRCIRTAGRAPLLYAKTQLVEVKSPPDPAPLPYNGPGAMPEWRRRNGPKGSWRRGGDLLEEPLEHRISGVARRQPPHVAAGFTLERGAAAGVAGEPELARGAGGLRGRPRERDAQQRVDAPRLVRVVLQRRRPPDVGARLEDQRRGVGWVVRGEGGEVRGGRGEAARVQGVEPGAQLGPITVGKTGAALQQQQRGDDERHVSE